MMIHGLLARFGKKIGVKFGPNRQRVNDDDETNSQLNNCYNSLNSVNSQLNKHKTTENSGTFKIPKMAGPPLKNV